MPINSTGPISLGGSVVGQSVNLELRKSATATVSMNDAVVRGLSGNATGAVSFSNFYGKSLSYAITPNISSVNEGGSVTFTVTTNGVLNGTVLYWSTNVVSGAVNATDFTGGLLTGSIIINSNTASISRTLSSDLTTEGTESFQLQLRTDSVSGTVVATSSTVTINDTSINLPGQVVFTTTSVNTTSSNSNDAFTTTSWTVPAGVTSISVVCVGGGGGGRAFSTNSLYAGGGGGGGALTYANNINVTPGQILRLDIGKSGGGYYSTDSQSATKAWPGGTTWLYNSTGLTVRVVAEGGQAGSRTGAAAGGRASVGQGPVGSVKYSGGAGGATAVSGIRYPSGGGGAAGYAGNGGAGGAYTSSINTNGASGTGGAGGGGGYTTAYAQTGVAGQGGGVGLTGQGANGTGGASGSNSVAGSGGPGSGGSGIEYGGGGRGRVGSGTTTGGAGAVRIMWPGNLRQYPSTRTANE